jgi:hypothetical protein
MLRNALRRRRCHEQAALRDLFNSSDLHQAWTSLMEQEKAIE